MNAMAEMVKAEMARVKLVWEVGGGNPHRRKTRAAKSKVTAAIKKAAEIHQVSPQQILGRSRPQAIVEARQAAMLFARSSGLSFTDIGLHMDRDHATIMHGVKAAQDRLTPKPIFKSIRNQNDRNS